MTTHTFLPNQGDATYIPQAEPDSVDFEILLASHKVTGVVSGCAVTESVTPAQTVDVSAGIIRIAGKSITVFAQPNQAVTVADGSLPRVDIVSVDSSGTVVVTDGVASSTPVAPTHPADSVVLAFLFVPAGNDTHIDNQINDKRVSVPAEIVFNVVDYGAVCDGVTDDTTAIQAAIDAAAGGTVLVPGFSIISSALAVNIENIGITIRGTSQRDCGIIQDTDNTPIFDFSDSGTAFWRVRDMTLTWTNIQTGNTSAYAFAFTSGGANPAGWGHYGWIVERVKLVNGYIGFGQTQAESSANPIWSATIRDCYVDPTWSGPVVDFRQTGNGQPSITIEKVFVRADVIPAASKLFHFGGVAGLTMRDVEIGNSNSYIEMQIENCLNVLVDNYRTEGGTLTTAYQGNFTVSNSNVLIRGLEVQDKTINHGGYSYAVRTTTELAKVEIAGLRLHDFTFTSGSYVIAECSVGAGVIVSNVIHNESSGDTLPWGASVDKFVMMEKGAPESAQVSEYAANVALNLSHGIVNMDTDAASRTVTLPDNAAYVGKNFMVRRDGTNTVLINCAGADTFNDTATSKTLGSDSAAIGFFSTGGGVWKIVGTQGTVT